MTNGMYTEQELLKIAKRVNNARRNYLLVNPLQAKHMPVSSRVSHSMMNELAKKIKLHYAESGNTLVIGFAETATAIAAVIAEALGDDCFFLHTTREEFSDSSARVLNFLEEHSHAVDQKLCVDIFSNLPFNLDKIVMVDDEISTGKTILNMISVLKEEIPTLKKVKFIAASIVNRMNSADKERFAQNEIEHIALLDIENRGYDSELQGIEEKDCIDALTDLEAFDVKKIKKLEYTGNPDPRWGLQMLDYRRACQLLILNCSEEIKKSATENESILFLGTEECMYPAILLSKSFEELGYKCKCHATTRSPITAALNPDYPIKEALKLKSFYDPERVNFVYNLEHYDRVVILTDSEADSNDALQSLANALGSHDCQELIFIRWVN